MASNYTFSGNINAIAHGTPLAVTVWNNLPAALTNGKDAGYAATLLTQRTTTPSQGNGR